MASQELIQSYLQKHRIGALFEDLMGKLINDQPDEPYHYLLRVLQLKAEKKGMSTQLRKSMGDLDSVAVAKDRTYDRPWQTNSKRQRPKELTDSKAPTRKSTASKPEWDKKTKSPTVFDDFWEQDMTKGQRSKSPSRIDRRNGGNAWADNGDEDLLFRSCGYRGPHRGNLEQQDPLSGEFMVAKETGVKATPKTCVTKTCMRGREQDSTRHKRQLEQYILNQQKTPDSGIEDERDLDPDSAVEMLEDTDVLSGEGVKSAKKTGSKFSKNHRQSSRSAAAQVKVSICARCAQMMAGGRPSSPAAGVTFDDLPDVDTHRDSASHVTPRSTRYTESVGILDDDEDEFESVSQVTGPRRPVWQETDAESLTPRKGAHMFTSSMSPAKGYPMYSAERPSASEGAPLQRSFQANKSEKRSLHQTWSPDVAADASSDVPSQPPMQPPPQTPVSTQEKDKSPAETVVESAQQEEVDLDTAGGSSGWKVPHDYDTDASSIYGAVSKGQRNRGSYQGAF